MVTSYSSEKTLPMAGNSTWSKHKKQKINLWVVTCSIVALALVLAALRLGNEITSLPKPVPEEGSPVLESVSDPMFSRTILANEEHLSDRILLEITAGSGQTAIVETAPGAMLDLKAGQKKWTLVAFPTGPISPIGKVPGIELRLLAIDSGPRGDSVIELESWIDGGAVLPKILEGVALEGSSISVRWIGFSHSRDVRLKLQPKCCVSCGSYIICASKVTGCGKSCEGGL